MRRALAGGVLVLAAVVVPCAYWYVSGSRAVDAERTALLSAPEANASTAANGVAARVSERLASLLQREDERPYFHYQNLFVDPLGAYDGAGVVPSPLAKGNADPLVVTNFQLEDGLLTVPTYNAEVEQAPQQRASAAPRELPEGLRVQLTERLKGRRLASHGPAGSGPSIRLPPPPAAKTAQRRAPPQAVNADTAQAGIQNAPTVQRQQRQMVQEQRLSASSYVANLNANRLYYDIQSKKGPVAQAKAPARRNSRAEAAAGNAEDVVVRVGPLRWHTLPISGAPTLVALRDVETPDGLRHQGFLLDQSRLAPLLQDGDLVATLEPGVASAPGEAAVDLDGSPWRVRVDFTTQLARAQEEASDLAPDFRARFFLLASLALLAGLAVVWWLVQSERLAQQRVRFAASAAHELRTPLAGLRMYGEMLAEGLGNPAKQQVYARRIANEAARLGRVVSNVLDFTRLERGSLAVSPVPHDVGKLTDEIASGLEPTVASAGATLTVDVPTDEPLRAAVDRDAFTQVLANLVDNAEKYSREAADRRIEIRVGASADGGAVETRVRDHGPGLSAAAGRRLFTAFERGGGDDQPTGLGLGLALTRALVRAHNGTIRHESPEGGGATFVVGFPRLTS